MITRNHPWNRWWTFVTVSVIFLSASSGIAFGSKDYISSMILLFLLGAELGTFITYIIMKDAEESKYVDRRYPKGFEQQNHKGVSP